MFSNKYMRSILC